MIISLRFSWCFFFFFNCSSCVENLWLLVVVVECIHWKLIQSNIRIQYENSIFFFWNVVTVAAAVARDVTICRVTVVVSRQCHINYYPQSTIYIYMQAYSCGRLFAGRIIPASWMLSTVALILIWCCWLKMYAGLNISVIRVSFVRWPSA